MSRPVLKWLLERCKPWTGRPWAYFLGRSWRHPPRGTTAMLSQRLAQYPLYRTAWTLTHHFPTVLAPQH